MLRRHHRSVSATFAGLLASCASASQPADGSVPPTAAPVVEVSPSAAVAAKPVPLDVDVAGDSLVLPLGLTSFGAATAGDHLYIFGGYFGSPHGYSEAEQSDRLLRLNIATGAWEHVGTSGRAQGVALVSHGGRLVRIGGMQARNAKGTKAELHSLDTVEAFDTATATWTELAPLPMGRSSHDAIVVGDTIWVTGGWALQGDKRVWHETLLRMDLSVPSPTWVETKVPFKRRAIATASANGKLVVLGGITSEGTPSSTVDVYDPKTDAWTAGPQFPGPGFGMAATSRDGIVYASGMAGVVYSWTPGATGWERVSSLAFPRFFHRLVPTHEGELLAVGGMRSMASGTRVRPIERIATRQSPAQTTLLSYTLTSPLPSKNRQGIAVAGDTLLFFGGNTSMGQHDFAPEFFTDVGYGLNLASMEWKPIAPYPARRQTMSAYTNAAGEVISVAGFGHDGSVARSHPEIFAYRTDTNEWTAVGKLPGKGRTQFRLAVRKDEILLFGGLDFDPTRPEADRFRHELPLLRAAASEDKVQFETSKLRLRQPRRAFAGALLDDTYYLVGGMQDGFALVAECEAYDFAKASWKTIACPPRARLSGEMVALNGKLYLAAGSSKGKDGKLGPNASLDVYDPVTDQWTTLLPELPLSTKHMRMLRYGDRLLVVSTHNEEAKAHVVLVAPPA